MICVANRYTALMIFEATGTGMYLVLPGTLYTADTDTTHTQAVQAVCTSRTTTPIALDSSSVVPQTTGGRVMTASAPSIAARALWLCLISLLMNKLLLLDV